MGNSEGELAIYETTGWQKIKSWKFTSATITKTEWNPHFPILAVAAFSHEQKPSIIQLYDVGRNHVISMLPDTVHGRGVSWSPSGEEVAYVGKNGSITIFTKEGEVLKTLSFSNPSGLFDIDWHPAKSQIIGVEEDIFLIDVNGGGLLATIDDGTKNKGILACAWHPSGEFFVTGDYGHENEGGEPSYLKYWSKEGILIKSMVAGRFEYRNIKWRKDGKYLAAAADVLVVFNEKGDIISKTKFDDNNLWGVEWNSKGDRIISSDQAGNIRLTDLEGKIVRIFTL